MVVWKWIPTHVMKCYPSQIFSTFGFFWLQLFRYICTSCTRPGGGPAEQGTDADLWHLLTQMAFYNGWKSVHGLKQQTVDSAFGIILDMYGPYSLRKNCDTHSTHTHILYVLFCLVYTVRTIRPYSLFPSFGHFQVGNNPTLTSSQHFTL